MALDLRNEKGTPLDRQRFTWREMVSPPISKLDDDAFTRVRVILMNGIELGSLRYLHHAARFNGALRHEMARVRRVDQHQATTVNWLLPADQSPLETTIAYEQVAIEVTARLALNEPDAYLAQAYRFGLLEDFDHLYRYAALLDRLTGKDANNITQCYTDIRPGRPTAVEHRHPDNDVRRPYDRKAAAPITKLNALTLVCSEQQTQDYYLNIGPLFADPLARQLYAEIASIEEQHVTHYESLTDPDESIVEKWLMHEACEVYNYYSCVQSETNPRIKAIWERFLDYELGQLHHVRELMKQVERRDPDELLPATMPDPIKFESHRKFVREVLNNEVDLRANGYDFVPLEQEAANSIAYREHLNSQGSPSEIAAAGYRWAPGTEQAPESPARSQKGLAAQ